MSTSSTSGGDPPESALAAAVVPAIVPQPIVGQHGFVVPFDTSQEEWSEYAERLGHYFIANDIKGEEKRRAILLNAVGASTYRLLKTLASPSNLTDLSVEEIVARAKAHFNTKPSPIVKRYDFNTRCQREGETITNYVAELWMIAEFCQYGAVLKDMLRDRLVCGISSKAIQRRLLQEAALTFDKALELALAAEAAHKDSQRLLGAKPLDKDLPTSKEVPELPSSQPPVHKVSESKPQQRNCKKKGHLAKMCRQKGREKSEQTHVVLDQQPVEDDKEYTMFHVHSGSTMPYRADVKVNGNSLSMEIDAGVSVSIVSKQTFETVREGTTSLVLKESAVKLQTYTGEVIGVCGSTMVPVEHNGQTVILPPIVTVGNGPSLLGRDWLSVLRLDWRSIFSVCPARTLQQVLEELSEVFREELGELRNVKAKIYVDKDTQFSTSQDKFHSQ